MRLTIAIPTFNRIEFLKRCLRSLASQINRLPRESQQEIDLYVSDNFSSDGTIEFLLDFQNEFESLRLNFGEKNQGPDWNIANCYDKALGDYVLVLGDDDLLIDGAIEWILNTTSKNDYGLLFLKAYSGEYFIAPPPSLLSRDLVVDSDNSILTLSDRLTFISSLVLKKNCFIQASRYLGTHLPQTYVSMEVFNKIDKHILSGKYFVFATRNNGGVVIDGVKTPPPPFGEVFILNIFNAFERYQNYLSIKKSLARKIFFYYFLYEISRRNEEGAVLSKTKGACDQIMGSELSYKFLRPLMFSQLKIVRHHVLQVLSLVLRVFRGEFLKFLNYWWQTRLFSQTPRR